MVVVGAVSGVETAKRAAASDTVAAGVPGPAYIEHMQERRHGPGGRSKGSGSSNGFKTTF
jgi:hypothetical protein